MRNVGTIDAMVRIAGGALLLAWASGRRRWDAATWLIAAFGASKVAEGAVRYCPVTDALGVTTREDAGDKPVLRVGPLVYRRVGRPPVRTLWGVRRETERDDLSYRAPAAVETNGWNWDGQPEAD